MSICQAIIRAIVRDDNEKHPLSNHIRYNMAIQPMSEFC